MEFCSFIVNYWSGAERSSRGYYKNLLLFDCDGVLFIDCVFVKDFGL